MKLQQLQNTDDHNRLFRGMGLRSPAQPGTVIDVPVRQDRKPLTASVLAAMLFDYGIERAFGVKNIRRRGLFCSTDRGQAQDYADAATGQRVVVELMPEPNTPVIYHPHQDDSYNVMSGDFVWDTAACVRDLMIKYKHPEVEFNTAQQLLTTARNNFHVNDYLNYDPLDLWKHEIELIIGIGKGDPADLAKAVNVFTNQADMMVKGYQQTTYGSFAGGKYIEAILYNIQTIKGKIL